MEINQLIEILNSNYPNARYELDWDTPLQLLIATILAAQCTDVRVNKVTKTLFPKYQSAQAFVDADINELEEVLKPTGFFKKKAQQVKNVCQALLTNFGGEVPRTMEQLITLPGVARKTANVVLNNAFRIPSGIIVDTHVHRISPRMGLTKEGNPETIERALMKIVPQSEWVQFGPAMVLHGRYVCTAKKPNCVECVLKDICPKIGVE
ncbi:MAG: endonuclease III [Blastocatellia bacterium]|nr:endonuclease III [Blastocatellia bacterium]MBL8193511.1 endonuclease III [Blastocatellia bacterium]MBN8723470.1 endonuclease III [Acidobacteriota bacterium]